MSAKFEAAVRPHLEAMLEPGESLDGVVDAIIEEGLLGGERAALGVTERRLLIQRVDKHAAPTAGPQQITPDWMAKAGPPNINRDIFIRRLRITSHDGTVITFNMNRGGPLRGGTAQHAGVATLHAWVDRHMQQR